MCCVRCICCMCCMCCMRCTFYVRCVIAAAVVLAYPSLVCVVCAVRSLLLMLHSHGRKPHQAPRRQGRVPHPCLGHLLPRPALFPHLGPLGGLAPSGQGRGELALGPCLLARGGAASLGPLLRAVRGGAVLQAVCGGARICVGEGYGGRVPRLLC